MFSVAARSAVRLSTTTSLACASKTGQRWYSGSSQQTRSKAGRFLLGAAITGAGLAATQNYRKQIEASAPQTDFKAVRAKIEKILDGDISHAPLLIRLAWHASGTYDKVSKTGGSNGSTMRFHPEAGHGANAGLHIARNLLEPIKAAHPELSYADLWTLAGVVAVEYMGGPSVKWRPGRVDKENGTHCTPDGRLPDADKGSVENTAQHVRDIFYRMGFNDREIVALVGAHSVGRCHVDRSGYVGPWTNAETSFTNEFFRELIENKWTEKKWNGPKQYEDPTGKLMMLPADLVLIQDPKFKQFVELYAKDQDLWFKDFAKAFQKLEELGVPFTSGWFDWITGPTYY